MIVQINKTTPEKKLVNILHKKAGRKNTGKITVRHRGGREKRLYRNIDFKRDKLGIPGKVIAFEYDPNRNVQIALINYQDGERRYILAPFQLSLNDTVISGENVEVKIGNSLSLANIPVGISIHNIELHQGRGGQLARGAGTMATVLAHEGGFTHIKLPSGEMRMVLNSCFATIGQLANPEVKNIQIGKAGRARRMGRRPTVRGTAQHPGSHPHGGGEGRSGVGLKHSKTPWGKPARGVRTRKKKKYSNRLILQRRKK